MEIYLVGFKLVTNQGNKRTDAPISSTFPASPSNGHGPHAVAMAPSEVVSLVQRTLQPEMSRRMEARQRMDDAAVRSAILGRDGNGNGDGKASNGDQR